MPVNDFRIDEFIDEFSDKTLPNFIFVLGDDVDQRFFVRKSLKKLFQKNHDIDNIVSSFIHESEGSEITFREVQSHGVHNGLFFDQKLIYLENFKKFKGFKKVKPQSICEYLISGELDNVLVLDIPSNSIPKEIELLEEYDITIHVIDCSTPKENSGEARRIVSFFCESVLGFKPQIGFVEFLIKTNHLNYFSIYKDLYTIILFNDEIDREVLDENLYKTTIAKRKNRGMDFFLYNFLTLNKVASLNLLEAFYKSEDKTIPLVIKLNEFIEKIYLVKRKASLNDYELSRLLYLPAKKITVMRDLSKRWEESKLIEALKDLAEIDSQYVASNYSKSIGKILIEQFILRFS